MSQNRIDPISTAKTGTRQTPRDNFGEVFAKGAKTVMDVAATTLSAVTTGSPVLSAAVSGITQVVGQATASSPPPPGGTPGAPPPAADATLPGGGGSGAGGSDAMELMRMQQSMQAEGFKLNTVYLGMQREMQRESREFSAVSNIMKVRHDTAKSAINNVR